jgi:DivIVA domain-containing protein
MLNDAALIIAAVAVIVVSAMVAAGRLTPGPEDDDETLMPDEAITAEHLETLRLSVTARGYRMDEVDVVLDRVIHALHERDARIAQLEQRLDNDAVMNTELPE